MARINRTRHKKVMKISAPISCAAARNRARECNIVHGDSKCSARAQYDSRRFEIFYKRDIWCTELAETERLCEKQHDKGVVCVVTPHCKRKLDIVRGDFL